MTHWAEKLIGIDYKKGGETTEGFDCWGLFRFVQKKYFNRDLPVINVDSNDVLTVAKAFRDDEQRNDWQRIKQPVNGCGVLLAHARYPSHVGVWLDIDGGGVLHCVKGIGVIFSSLSSLKLSGWGRIEYYEYCPRP